MSEKDCINMIKGLLIKRWPLVKENFSASAVHNLWLAGMFPAIQHHIYRSDIVK